MKYIDVAGPIIKPYFVLIYGASGTGKTHLTGTLGELGSVLFIDIDTGYETLSAAKKLVKYRDNITAVSFDTFGDLNSAYKLVQKNDPVQWTKKFGINVDKPYDWIVWDTWSELQFYMMEELRSQKDHGKFEGLLNFRKNVEIQHWGLMTDLNKLSIEELRKCSVNQAFTMQEKLEKDELSGQIFGGPAIHGKMVQEMPAYFGVVIHTGTDAMGRFTATTKSKSRWPAKTRRGDGQDFVDPTMKAVLGL